MQPPPLEPTVLETSELPNVCLSLKWWVIGHQRFYNTSLYVTDSEAATAHDCVLQQLSEWPPGRSAQPAHWKFYDTDIDQIQREKNIL